MDNYNKDIDDIRNLFKIKMLNNLLKFLNKTDIENPSINIENPNKDIVNPSINIENPNKDIVNNEINRVGVEYENMYLKKKIGYDNTKANQFIDVITMVPFQKHWKNLDNIHKIIKITEYVDNLQMDNIANKKTMLNKLIEMLKMKKLKNSDVIYDYNICKITQIDMNEK